MAEVNGSSDLEWDGAVNVRDLGGLPLASGGVTRSGRIYRSASIDGLSQAGWDALVAAGVTTVLDLRGEHEKTPAPLRPADLVTVRAPLEDVEDRFYREWDGKHGSMDYFRAGMDHWPDLWAAAASSIAALPADGALLVHCAAGRDRTGAITSLILDAAGVPRERIVDEYVAGIHGAGKPKERDVIMVDARDALPRLLDAPRTPELEAALERVAARLV